MVSKNVIGGLAVIAGGIGTFTHAVLTHGENDLSNEFVLKYPTISFVVGIVGGYIAISKEDYTTVEKLGIGAVIAVVTTIVTPLIALGVWDFSTGGDIEQLRTVLNDENMDSLTIYQKMKFVEDDVENIVVESN